MGFLYIILFILVFDYVLERVLSYLNSKNWSEQLPEQLRGIYDEEKYAKSQQYEKHKQKFSLVSDTITFVVMILVLTLGGFAMVDHWIWIVLSCFMLFMTMFYSNLSNLMPHPAYVFFYYSHPTLLQRLNALEKL